MIDIGASCLEFRAILSCLYHRDNEIISLPPHYEKLRVWLKKQREASGLTSARHLLRWGDIILCWVRWSRIDGKI